LQSRFPEPELEILETGSISIQTAQSQNTLGVAASSCLFFCRNSSAGRPE
jgi:hypothetical protein